MFFVSKVFLHLMLCRLLCLGSLYSRLPVHACIVVCLVNSISPYSMGCELFGGACIASSWKRTNRINVSPF